MLAVNTSQYSLREVLTFSPFLVAYAALRLPVPFLSFVPSHRQFGFACRCQRTRFKVQPASSGWAFSSALLISSVAIIIIITNKKKKKNDDDDDNNNIIINTV